jgi:hypothetical protein
MRCRFDNGKTNVSSRPSLLHRDRPNLSSACTLLTTIPPSYSVTVVPASPLPKLITHCRCPSHNCHSDAYFTFGYHCDHNAAYGCVSARSLANSMFKVRKERTSNSYDKLWFACQIRLNFASLNRTLSCEPQKLYCFGWCPKRRVTRTGLLEILDGS